MKALTMIGSATLKLL